MPNPRYIKGRAKEQKIVRDARNRGYIAFRSAGSKSPIDCTVIDMKHKQITFIQAKPDDFPESQKLKLEAQMADLNNTFKVFFKVL
jgi:Holliday junction resolvase